MCFNIWTWAGLTLPFYISKEVSVLLTDDPKIGWSRKSALSLAKQKQAQKRVGGG